MRFEFAVIGILAIAGCQTQRGYTARCPHCNQAHTVSSNQTAAPSSISPVTYNDADAPAPLPKNYAAAFDPVPSVPGVD
ncbi:MAG: hypothetical protein JWP89_6663 [Schlesneria sp.]|nr:hypothetical protein [Schlesneria sp.]